MFSGPLKVQESLRLVYLIFSLHQLLENEIIRKYIVTLPIYTNTQSVHISYIHNPVSNFAYKENQATVFYNFWAFIRSCHELNTAFYIQYTNVYWYSTFNIQTHWYVSPANSNLEELNFHSIVPYAFQGFCWHPWWLSIQCFAAVWKHLLSVICSLKIIITFLFNEIKGYKS